MALCCAEESVLLVVDIQTVLTAVMDEEAASAMLASSSALLQAASRLDVPLFMTEQYPQGLGETEPSLAELMPSNVNRFEKTGFSSCSAEGFVDALAATGRKQVVMVGQETHVCILQTALDLLNRGYKVFVVEDAVCSRKYTHRLFALERMQQFGVTVTNYESVLFEWLRDASHPEFKAIAQLLV